MRPVRSGLSVGLTLLGAACGTLGFGESVDRNQTADADPSASDASRADARTVTGISALAPAGAVEVGAEIRGLLASGDLLFATTSRPGAELVIYSIAAGVPVELGAVATAGLPHGLAVDGALLYVTSDAGGDDLEIFDVSLPSAPVKLGGVAAADSAYKVHVAAGRAYVTTAAGGDDLQIFDVRDPAAPTLLGGIDLLPSYYVRGVDVVGTIAYTAGQRLSAIDVSDPASPRLLGEAGFYWYAYDLAVAGDRVIGLESNNSNSEQLRVWDFTQPATPVLIGAARTWDSYARDIEIVAGRFAFTVCAPGGYDWGAELEVFDVLADGAPPRVASVHLTRDGHAVEVVGDHVYVGSMNSADPELLVFRIVE